jgi:hypothetical protein
VASTSLPPAAPHAHLEAGAHDRESRVVVGWLSQVVIWVLDVTMKVVFISFWFLLISVIRLQAGW